MASQMLLLFVAALIANTMSQGIIRSDGRLLSVLTGGQGLIGNPLAVRRLPALRNQIITVVDDESYKPYRFAFDLINEDGSTHAREESQDGSGNVLGIYSLSTPDGRQRFVRYEATANGGVTQHVVTNEPGTKTSEPAAALIEANPLEVVEHKATPIQLVQRPLLGRVQLVQQPLGQTGLGSIRIGNRFVNLA